MSLTMLGQPKIGSWLQFDITQFGITKEDIEEEGAVVEILDENESFTLRLDFEGSGTDWVENMCDREKLEYKVEFFAEGIGRRRGGGPGEYNLGEDTGNLEEGKYDYTHKFTVDNGIARPGVYRLAAMLTFPNKVGVLGFAEGVVIQVHGHEE